jgi:thiol-disulfide isomerase/thioredoxin
MPSVRATLGLAPKPTAPSYRAGDRIDLSPELLQSAPSTLVIFFRSDCGVCQRMRPILTKLVARGDRTVHVIAVTGTENRKDAATFVTQIGLGLDRLVTMDLKAVRVTTVPTLVIVDRDGTIRMAVEGLPPPAAQDALLRQMLATSLRH